MQDLLNLDDYERAAREVLPPSVLGYYASGADDEVTLREERASWSRFRLLPRVLRGGVPVDTTTRVVGHDLDWPVVVAPMAMQGMACDEGEVATARAAARSGSALILSTISNRAVEDVVAAAAGSSVWFQLYVYRDRAACRELVRCVEEAGCTALVLTVDVPHLGRREADLRNRFAMPAHLELPNVGDRGEEIKTPSDGPASALAAHAASRFDLTLTWEDLDWLCASTKLPVLAKGILDPDDAVRAFEHGAAGVVVSTHPGRQLDTALPSAEALRPVIEAVDGRGDVLVDGGIRRGTDVVKALALGARAVLLGRPVLWGLAVAGEDGAARVLELLRDELRVAMTLCGRTTLSELDLGMIVPPLAR